jgi:hypothetical protein
MWRNGDTTRFMTHRRLLRMAREDGGPILLIAGGSGISRWLRSK